MKVFPWDRWTILWLDNFQVLALKKFELYSLVWFLLILWNFSTLSKMTPNKLFILHSVLSCDRDSGRCPKLVKDRLTELHYTLEMGRYQNFNRYLNFYVNQYRLLNFQIISHSLMRQEPLFQMCTSYMSLKIPCHLLSA